MCGRSIGWSVKFHGNKPVGQLGVGQLGVRQLSILYNVGQLTVGQTYIGQLTLHPSKSLLIFFTFLSEKDSFF
jgi:hypothetical protein